MTKPREVYYHQSMRIILITNDDGIASEGLHRLVEAAKPFGDILVVAPDSQRSAASHSITLTRPVEIRPYDFPVPGVRAFQCDGTPADCVRIAVRNILGKKPDVVFSGINYGYNVAMDLQYSATAGAAFEALALGIRAVAFSEGAKPCHEVADAYLTRMIEELIDKETPKGSIWNVNFPYCPLSDCAGILYDRTVSTLSFFNYDEEERLPDGGMRLTVRGNFGDTAEDGTDLRAVHERFVSVGTVSNIGM